MTWIRSPGWDGFWILSGLPIGIILMLTCPGMVPALVVAIMILESAHVVSPMLLAWTRPELRRIVCQEWVKHIVLPAAILALSLVTPYVWARWIYVPWNIYHFGMQNFGVTSLYWRGKRELRKWLCLGITVLCMGVLLLLTPDDPIFMLGAGIFSFGHWLTDIGLSSRRVSWHWGFIGLVATIGVVWFGLRQGPLSIHSVAQIPVIRDGIGMVHFIYSARIWKLSDPEMRVAIGRDLRAKNWPTTNKLRVA